MTSSLFQNLSTSDFYPESFTAPEFGDASETGLDDGFRLHRLEILNWGTFDNAVHVLELDGKATLLVGKNGTGKSTLVDAVLTLLVRSGDRNYNVAAGAEKSGQKKERSEKTYIKGACGSIEPTETRKEKTEYLRSEGNQLSVILAVFKNGLASNSKQEDEESGIVTLAQVLYLDREDQSQHIFCIDDREQSIVGNFNRVKGADGLFPSLKKKWNVVCREFREYQRQFKKRFGFKDKATDVFNQTVAVKDIRNLNDFIRKHMLDSVPRKKQIENIVEHFEHLKQSYDSLVRIRKQVGQLEPIANKGCRYKELQQQHEFLELLNASFEFFRAKTKLELLRPHSEKLREKIESLSARSEEIDRTLSQKRGEQRHLLNEIEGIGGDRGKELTGLITAETDEIERKQKAFDRFCEILKQVKIEAVLRDESDFLHLREKLQDTEKEFDQQHLITQAKRDQLIPLFKANETSIKSERLELESLQRRKTSLPESHETMRRSICEALHLQEKSLPYIAELIAVSDAEKEWEPSLEMVLGGFALQLLVPTPLYERVSEYIDRHRMENQHGRGERLRYQKVGKFTDQYRTKNSAPIVGKLDFKQHDWTAWLREEVSRRFDLQCCESVAEFQQRHEYAITKNRHIKWQAGRHEKDDRDMALDRRNYVLGWNNREKQQTIIKNLERLVAENERLDRKMKELSESNSTLIRKTEQIRGLLACRSFSEINVTPHQERLQDYQCELRRLTEGNSKLKDLKAREARLRNEIETKETEQKSVNKEQGTLEGQYRTIKSETERYESRMNRVSPERLEQFQTVAYPKLELRLGADKLTIDNSDGMFETLASQIDNEKNEVDKEKMTLHVEIVRGMTKFLGDFPEMSHDLQGDIVDLDSFIQLRDYLKNEGLPEQEEDFKLYMDENVAKEIGILRGNLDTQASEIRKSINVLNESLSLLPYNLERDTYMELEAQTGKSPQVNKFNQMLQDCIDQSFEASMAVNEDRYKKFEKLIVDLKADTDWADRVVDVRNWFNFVAHEKRRIDDEKVAYYEDSSGQSGGEKSKLAFTILVASIAYQYNIDPHKPRPDRFHFVMVDEMFTKVDDQYSEYALKLFGQFGLQLLIVAPFDAKARITEPFVERYFLVQKNAETKQSHVVPIKAEQLRQSILESDTTESDEGNDSPAPKYPR